MHSKTGGLWVKIISKVLIIFILSFWVSSVNASGWFFESLFWGNQAKVHIDCGSQDCNIESGIKNIKDSVNGIEQERTISEYIQDVVAYLLTFISIIAVIYIIYAWFRILTWAWEEEVLKKQKATILYVVIWIAVIWLAYPITKFILTVFNW